MKEAAILLRVDIIPSMESCHCRYRLSTVIEKTVPVNILIWLDYFYLVPTTKLWNELGGCQYAVVIENENDPTTYT